MYDGKSLVLPNLLNTNLSGGEEVVLPSPRFALYQDSATPNQNIFQPTTGLYQTNFTEFDTLAKGGFGTVCKALDKLEARLYAVKKIPFSSDSSEAELDKILREVRWLARLDHPNVIRYYTAWIEATTSPTVEERNSFDSDYEETESEDENAPYLEMKFSQLYDEDDDLYSSSWESDSEDFFRELSDSGPRRRIPSSHSQQILYDISDSDSDDFPTVQSLSMSASFSTTSESRHCEESFSDVPSVPPTTLDCLSENTARLLRRKSSVDTIPLERITRNDELVVFSSDGSRSRKKRTSTRDADQSISFYLYIKTQLYTNHTLAEWLASRQCISVEENISLFAQLCVGLQYIHSQGCVHRDIKPANIFLSEDGIVKIGDFGLAREASFSDKARSTASPSNHTSGLGTSTYAAPEQMNGHEYGHKVDIYPMGIICFEMHWIFHSKHQRAKLIMDLKRNASLPEGFSQEYPQQAKLILAMTNMEETLRPDAHDLAWLFGDMKSKLAKAPLEAGTERKRIADEILSDDYDIMSTSTSPFRTTLSESSDSWEEGKDDKQTLLRELELLRSVIESQRRQISDRDRKITELEEVNRMQQNKIEDLSAKSRSLQQENAFYQSRI